ncbi:MAG: hypothetical protein R2795_24900 [Saprospiraceae bacterium]
MPQPDAEHLFTMVYGEREYLELPAGLLAPRVTRLHTGVVDMSANNGNGRVVEKDFPLIVDTLDAGKITACRHGNGRDWWIVVPYFRSDKYHTLLPLGN